MKAIKKSAPSKARAAAKTKTKAKMKSRKGFLLAGARGKKPFQTSFRRAPAGLFLSFLFFLLPACDYLIPSYQPATKTSPVQTPVPSQSEGGGTGAVSAAGDEWGVVSCASDSEYQEFNRQVRQFISTSFDPNSLPALGCAKNHGGGRVFFKGSVVFDGGAALNSSNPSASLNVNPDSWIEIHIDTVDRSKKTQAATSVEPVRLSAARTAPGNIEGRAAALNFQDDKGEIRMEGRIEGDKFKGQLHYKNYKTWRGGEGFEGNMGIFTIRACRFLSCS